uniref:Uncharacterized protein n=1 Tax=Glossina pallidipes TaxID=7398 RepID=A0A1B0AJL9_GLOPL
MDCRRKWNRYKEKNAAKKYTYFCDVVDEYGSKLSTIQSRPASHSFIDFEMIEGERQKEDICIQITAIIKRHRCYNECGTEDEDKNLYLMVLRQVKRYKRSLRRKLGFFYYGIYYMRYPMQIQHLTYTGLKHLISIFHLPAIAL